MKTTHKFRLESAKKLHTLRLREGYRILGADYIVADKAIHLWVEEPVNMLIPRYEHHFLVDTFGRGTCQVFEVSSAHTRGGSIAEPMAAA